MTSAKLKSFFLSNIAVLLLTNGAAAVNYLSQIMLGRWLAKDDFGIAIAILALGPAVFSFSTVIPFVVMRQMVKFSENLELRQKLLELSLLLTIALSAIAAIAGVLFSGNIATTLKIDSYLPIILMFVFLGLTQLHNFFSAVIQGAQKFELVAAKDFLFSLLKFGLIYVFAKVAMSGFMSPIYAELLATVFTALCLAFFVKKLSLFKPRISLHKGLLPEVVNMVKYGLPVAITAMVVGALSAIDIILVKAFASPEVAGSFAASASIGRAAFFLPGSLANVLYVKVMKETSEQQSSIPAFVTVAGLTVLIAFTGTIIAYFLGNDVLQLLYGSAYTDEAGVLWKITAYMGLLAIIQMIFNFLLAKNILGFIPFTIGVLGLTVGAVVYKYNQSAAEIATTILAGLFLLFILSVGYLTLLYRHEKSAHKKLEE